MCIDNCVSRAEDRIMSSMKVVTALISFTLLTCTSFAQRPKPAPQSPARSSQGGQTTKPDSQDKNKQDKNKDDDIASSDEAVRLGADLVNVLFTAVDRNNRVISDIRQDEISVMEDGRPQQIFTFKRETTLPINIAILMDLSGSQEYTFPQEKLAAGEFLHSIIRPAKDSAAILTFENDVELVQGLSSRTETLNRAFDEIQYSRRFGSASSRHQATALYDAIYITADEVLARDEIRRGAIDEQVTRRAIILLTDGVDNASSRKLDEAIDRAWRAGVIIYSIGIGDRFRFEGVRED